MRLAGQTGGVRASWPVAVASLALLSCVVLVRAAPASDNNNNNNTDQVCNLQPVPAEGFEEVQKYLFVLRCNMKPLLDDLARYKLLAGPQHLAEPDTVVSSASGQKSPTEEFQRLGEHIEAFYVDAMFVLSHVEFCTYKTISKLSSLKATAGKSGSSLLQNIYGLISVEYHTRCLKKVITNMPPVPYLVRDVVKIYIDGPDTVGGSRDHKPSSFYDSAYGEEFSFEVEKAIRRHGTLDQVMLLTFSMPSSFNLNADPADDDNEVSQFVSECNSLLVALDERWQSMEMMNDLVSDDVNNISHLNNYIMRLLAPTKYAAVCGQLCEYRSAREASL